VGNDVVDEVSVDLVDDACVDISDLKEGGHFQVMGTAVHPDHVRHPQSFPSSTITVLPARTLRNTGSN